MVLSILYGKKIINNIDKHVRTGYTVIVKDVRTSRGGQKCQSLVKILNCY